ncbi:hypothetical protein [Shewanella sp. NIFS-20-20]|uniref:hypothetical protein n=1 Tax=Shewanella sp. NIFS-20-20 TaxID=2853806 RepID=UPI001C4742A2|nr:hypothetical protein [Shewanella sp. NIFS-20-20]MBV7317285.1 hypothetical protein [Shewanella sp. NIFS-20-20]
MKIMIALLSLFLVSCTSMPMLTMLQFSLMDDDYLAKLTPEEIQAKITFIGTDASAKNPVLSFVSEPSNQRFNFELEQVSSKRFASEKGFFFASLPKTEFLYQLSADGVAEFKSMQELIKTGRLTSLVYNIDTQEVTIVKNSEYASYLTLAVQLEQEQGFITLLDKWEFADSLLPAI